MNKEITKKFALLMAFCLLLANSSLAAEEKAAIAGSDQKAGAAMDPQMEAKWKEYSTPNENHKVLNQFVGNWNYTMKFWMAPGAPVEESTGTAEAQWIMDGRFLSQKIEGTSMGQPFTGKEITGYDNAQKQYVAVWFDNMGTGMTMATGSYDAATKTFTKTGTSVCPFRGKMTFRWVTKIIDANTFIFEMYMPDEKGNEYKSMEATYTKKS